jgi:hypothetical protein
MIPVAALLAGAEIASNVANVIQVGIMVNDALTPTLSQYDDHIESLDQATGSWLDQFIMGVPSMALDGFRNMVDYLKTGFQEAAAIQTSMIAASSDLATNLKIPIDAISELAAALPGETAGYADIYRSISGTLSKQFSGAEFKQQSEEFTKRIGLLAAIRGADAATAGNASNRFLAGTMGFGEAIVQDIFQRNPALYTALLDQLNTMKVDPEDWKKVQQSVRTKIFSAALAKAAPDALIAEFEGTFQGTIETIKTQVFDPIKGLFGLLRRIDNLGNRTALDAANGVLQALNSLKDSFVTIAQSLGVNLDPVYYLINVLDVITDTIGKLHLAVISADPVTSFSKWVDSIPTLLAGWAVSAIEYLSTLVNRLLGTGIDGAKIGKVIGTFYNIFESIKDKILDNIDAKQLAELYYKVSREIADAQGAIWWESIRIIPTRLANWFSELWVHILFGISDIRVKVDRFIEVMDKLTDAIGLFINPLGALTNLAGRATTVQADPNAPTTKGILGNTLGGIVDSGVQTGLDWNKQLGGLFNKPKPVKTSFNPSFTINASTNASADEIASLAQERMYEAYAQYQNGVLS